MTRNFRPHPKPEKPTHFIKAWRKYRDITQERLAERIDATPGAISQLENGKINYTQPMPKAAPLAPSLITARTI
jgi:transcriptional regulator with XRE-family HTH domain